MLKRDCEAMKIIRVFPSRTSYTPTDEMAFVGYPPLWRPECDEVHVSVTFTWDLPEAENLVKAWSNVAPVVKLGGPATGKVEGDFTPGMYVREGVTFTSRGCNNHCPWCLVPEREGKLRELPIKPGYIIQDNNFLQCSKAHRMAVYEMLKTQKKGAIFAGGLDSHLVTDEIADELHSIRIEALFFAADTVAALEPLAEALKRLTWLDRRKLRCYVLLGYRGETISQAEWRLEAVWKLGAMPFAQLYRPPTGEIEWSKDWRALARTWSRPAAMIAMHKEDQGKEQS